MTTHPLKVSCQLFIVSLLACSRPAVPTDRQDVVDSMVAISTVVDYKNTPHCTGFWIGYIDIATAKHCVSKNADYNDLVTFSIYGDKAVYHAKVARYDDELIILRTYMPPPREHTWLAPARVKPKKGTPVSIVGHALGVYEYSVLSGMVTAVEKPTEEFIGGDVEIDAIVPKGFSGAAVVSDEGLLGIITSGTPGDVRAIHVKALRSLVKTMPPISVPNSETCNRDGGDRTPIGQNEMYGPCPPLQGDLGPDYPYWPRIYPPDAKKTKG
jgi:hypothetical protein